jgi:hypothetical protein
MNTLFVAMQDPASRRWAPVGRLTRDNGQYRFVYTWGCRTMPDFAAFGRLTDLNAEYVSEEMRPGLGRRRAQTLSGARVGGVCSLSKKGGSPRRCLGRRRCPGRTAGLASPSRAETALPQSAARLEQHLTPT